MEILICFKAELGVDLKQIPLDASGYYRDSRGFKIIGKSTLRESDHFLV